MPSKKELNNRQSTNNRKEKSMENQHRKIKGYRELSQTEIDAMNLIKEKAAEAGKLCEALSVSSEIDGRWLAIGKTDLQKGVMALTRAVAKPEFF